MQLLGGAAGEIAAADAIDQDAYRYPALLGGSDRLDEAGTDTVGPENV